MRFLLLRTIFTSSKALHPTVVDRCSDRHFSLCPVVGGNSPREFRPLFPRIKIPSWMHSELHFPTVNIQRSVLPQKMQNRQHNCHVTDRQRNKYIKYDKFRLIFSSKYDHLGSISPHCMSSTALSFLSQCKNWPKINTGSPNV